MTKIDVNSLVNACEQVLYPSVEQSSSDEGRRYLRISKNGTVNTTWKQEASSLRNVANAFHHAVTGIQKLHDPDKIRKVAILEHEIDSILLKVQDYKMELSEGPWYKKLLFKMRTLVYHLFSYDLPEESLTKSRNRLEKVRQTLLNENPNIKEFNEQFKKQCNDLLHAESLTANTVSGLKKQYTSVSTQPVSSTVVQEQLEKLHSKWKANLQSRLIIEINEELIRKLNELGEKHHIEMPNILSISVRDIANENYMEELITSLSEKINKLNPDDPTQKTNLDKFKPPFNSAVIFWRAELNNARKLSIFD